MRWAGALGQSVVTGVREIVAVDISTIGMRDGFWKEKEFKENEQNHGISFLRYIFESADF